MSEAETLLSADDVAQLLGVEKSWVLRAVKRGDLPYLRLGRYVRFKKESIMRWIEEQEVTA